MKHDILERIDKRRKELKIPKTKICEELNIAKNSYNGWENGNSESFLKYLPQIASVLNCSVDYLATGKKNGAEELWRAFNAAPEQVRAGIRVILGIY